jgi:hypothetical protein
MWLGFMCHPCRGLMVVLDPFSHRFCSGLRGDVPPGLFLAKILNSVFGDHRRPERRPRYLKLQFRGSEAMPSSKSQRLKPPEFGLLLARLEAAPHKA